MGVTLGDLIWPGGRKHLRQNAVRELPSWTPPVQLGRFLADVPDGARITTDPETAGVVRSAIEAAGRQITVKAYPFVTAGDLCANWDGPAVGEHHEVRTWL